MTLHPLRTRFLVSLTALAAAALSIPLAAQPAAPAEPPRAPSQESLVTTPAEREARLGWWREARFGMFVHWGVYSGLSGTWQGKAYGGYGEHIQRMAKIPIPVYHREVAGAFNPVHFDADAWIRLAKEAGMGYFVITAKHHDGFAMFDSKVSDATIVKATPFARDPMIELRDACRRHGLKFGFYYSHAFDWGEADGPGNDWDFENPGGDRLLGGSDWWKTTPSFIPRARRYVDTKSIPQILELIRNYDPDILWFDTPHKLPPEENRRIMAAVRAAKPSLVINGRLIYGLGDYDTTCDKPAEFPPNPGDWEGVPTTNESYGYNANDHSHKPAAHFIRLLAKSVARGGNELMNIGPMGDGRIDPADIAILRSIGAWWSVNGSSIRGTNRTPLAVQAWGESTRKGDSLCLHVFDWPKSGRLVVGGLSTGVRRAYLLSAPDQSLETLRAGPDLIVSVPTAAPDAADSVVVLECAAAPLADATVRLLSTEVPVNTLHVFDGKLEGSLRFGSGTKDDDRVQNWTRPDDAVLWTLRVNESADFDLALYYDAPAPAKSAKLVEGPAGKELAPAQSGAGGTYLVSLAGRELTGTLRQGNQLSDTLGSVTLAPGEYTLRVSSREITGRELFRLRKLTLTPRARTAAVTVDLSRSVTPSVVTAPDTGNNQLLYFTSPSLTDDGRHLVLISDRTGHPNLFVRDLETGVERQISRNTEGVLKSYVYFDGTPYRGFGKGSVSLDPANGTVYYIQGREIRAVTLAGVERVLATLPAGQMTAFTHVSADGTRLCVPTTDERALDGDKQLAGRPDYDIDARVVAEKLNSYLRVFDTATGREIACERVPSAWVTHVQFSPVNPDLILYNHEYCSDSGIRRMWLWDGRAHLRLRTEGEGRSRLDWTCHEMWQRDGLAIIYHGAYANGASYVGRVRPDGTGTVEISLPAAWKRYGHFTVGRSGELVTDGYYEVPGDSLWGGAWLSRLDVNWSQRSITWFPIARHGSSWTSQDCHPHPVFNRSADAIYFTSDEGGLRSVRRLALPANTLAASAP